LGTAFVELPQQRKGPQTCFKKRRGNERPKYGVLRQDFKCKGELEGSMFSLLSGYILNSVFLISDVSVKKADDVTTEKGNLHLSGTGVFIAGKVEAGRTVCVCSPVEVYMLFPRSAHVHLEEGRGNTYCIIRISAEC